MLFLTFFTQFQKKLSKLEEQLSNELQAKDELEQKYRWDCYDVFGMFVKKYYYTVVLNN